MSTLAYHNELQKGLDAITRVVRIRNDLQLHVKNLEDELVEKRKERNLIERVSREWISERKSLETAIMGLKSAIREANAELDAVYSTIQELELERALEMNRLSAAHNSADEMSRLKELSKTEMNLYAKMKAEKMDQFNSASKDLASINGLISDSRLKYGALTRKISLESHTLEQRERAADEKESGLVVWQMNLKKYEERLMKYAEKLNINL